MKPKVWLILGLGLAALVFAFAITLNLLPAKTSGNQAEGSQNRSNQISKSPPTQTDPAAGSTPKKNDPTQPGSTPATPTPSDSATVTVPGGSEVSAPVVPAEPEATKQGGPAATPDPARPLEVNTPAPEATQRVLPPSKPQTALVAAPLPHQADAVGGLAAGYPDQALPALEGSKITSSSVSPQDGVLHTTLVASSAAEPLAVQAFYQQQLAPLGFGTAEAPAPAGSTATWFTRGTDKITLTVTPVEGGASYIVYGVLHAGE